MIKLNRTTEYGLIALRHIGRKRLQDPHAVTSAREIADTYGLPFEITAKTLQRLKERGLIHSEQGARGGYLLERSLEQVNLAEFLSMMEGTQAVVPCAAHEPSVEAGCEYSGKCEMRGLMTDLNARVWNFLSGIRLSELAGMPGSNAAAFLSAFASTAPMSGFPGALTGAAAAPAGLAASRLGDEP